MRRLLPRAQVTKVRSSCFPSPATLAVFSDATSRRRQCLVQNVVIHQVATAVELGDVRRALGVARQFRFDRQDGFEERGARHMIDVARAHATLGARSEAVDALLAAERTAPEETRSHRLTRQVLRQLVSSPGRASLPRIRSLMQRCGLQ